MFSCRKKHGMSIQFDIQNLFIAKSWRPGLKRIEL
jgi:hypothetical protein